MSRWNKDHQARAFEEELTAQLESLLLPNPNHFKRLLEQQIQELRNQRLIVSKQQSIEKISDEHNNVDLNLGHSMDEIAPPSALRFDTGATLGFIVTLRETQQGANLLSASFNLLLPAGVGLQFIRIHLEGKIPSDPISKSRSHIHPGFQNVHVPFPVMDPRTILDRIAFEFVPKFRHK